MKQRNISLSQALKPQKKLAEDSGWHAISLHRALLIKTARFDAYLQQRLEVTTAALLHHDVHARAVLKGTDQLHHTAAQLQSAWPQTRKIHITAWATMGHAWHMQHGCICLIKTQREYHSAKAGNEKALPLQHVQLLLHFVEDDVSSCTSAAAACPGAAA